MELGPVSAHERERALLVAACRHLAGAGLSPGSSGNLSMRVGEDAIIVTPTGTALRRVTADELVLVGEDGRVRSTGRPTKELPIHLAVYHARPTAAAIVHLHSPFATAVSCLPASDDGTAALPAHTPYRVMRLGAVPVAAYAPPGSPELGASVGGLAAQNAVILLGNHGSLVAGSSVDAAVDLAEELEAAAQLSILLHPFPALLVDPASVAALTTIS